MRWLSHLVLSARGWSIVGELPSVPKMIIIGAPHTTNWDFFLYQAVLHHLGIRTHFLAKHTLFRWPFGYLFRAIGGIPVDRARAGGVVGEVKRQFEASEEMILVIAPEGTRKRVERWKSGFIEIAHAAEVPIVPAGVDYPSRTVTIGPAIEPTEDRKGLMTEVRHFYADKIGLRAGQQGPIAVSNET